MSQNISDDSKNVLFKRFGKLTNLTKQLREAGVKDNINLPRICVIGNKMSGKSSVLESIIGLDILPKGDGIVNRRALELHLNHINSGEPWAEFEERKDIKFTDFTKLEETIEELNEELRGKYNEIINKPIILNIYSQTCPDLTLIDLPGIERIPMGECPKNVDIIGKIITKKYIEDPLTIILCVIPANSDIWTSDSLRMAKEIDESRERTIGVLTKIDIMDQGTDVRKFLLNEEIPLKMGYVGMINRSKQDRVNKLSLAEAKIKEKEFFKSHSAYNDLSSELLGTEALINKLTKLYFKMVKENCPIIDNAINERIKKVEKELADLKELKNEMQINICDENISNTQVNKKIDEKKETTSTEQEKPKEPDSKPKNNVKKKYGNLFG